MDLELIDRLNDAQVEDLHRLYQQEWWTRQRTIEQVRRLLEHSNLIVAFCQRQNGQLIAFARVLTDFTIKALILDVIVDRNFRGSGLGKDLMDAVVSHPRLAPVANLELYCRPEMIPFYQRWEFAETHPDLRLMRLTRPKN